MTVYRPKHCRRYRYDFTWRGVRYAGPTGMSRQRDAEEFERKERVRLERQAGDLSMRASETPRLADWAAVFYKHKLARGVERGTLKRPDLLQREIRVVLEFCGSKPTAAPTAKPSKRRPPRRVVPVAPPYHDLRLGDFIERPEWITTFEDWLTARGTGGSARNHYRSVMSGFYKIAMLPEYRRVTGVRANPFAGLERDRQPRRRVTLTVEELRRWVSHASPHARLALAIGGLAPALRLGSILGLQWGVHLAPPFHLITVTDHKTDRLDPEPLVIPVAVQLRGILERAHAAWKTARDRRPTLPSHVVQFHGHALGSIKKALRAAATRAGVHYGTKNGGATFHTLRHTMATILAEAGVAEAHRKSLLNHADIATTQIYTHLRPIHLLQPLETLSAEVPLEDVLRDVSNVPTRGRRKNPRENRPIPA